MYKFTTSLQSELNDELEHLNLSSDSPLQKVESAVYVTETALKKLKNFTLQYTFKSDEEEIRFFKEIKPELLAKHLFYIEIYFIEANKPEASKKALKHYFSREIKRVQMFRERNSSFYNYYRAGKTSLDEIYFLRNKATIQPSFELFSVDLDPLFTTIHSTVLAQLKASELLVNYLKKSIYELDHSAPYEVIGQPVKKPMVFTDAKAGLIELGYAFFANGTFNNGKASLKEIMELLSFSFNVDLGNFYAVFHQNIRLRKKDRSAYLRKLLAGNETYMDEQDANPSS